MFVTDTHALVHHVTGRKNRLARGARRIFGELGAGAILTIGESEGFIAEGGIANFKLERGRIRIQINPKARVASGGTH